MWAYLDFNEVVILNTTDRSFPKREIKVQFDTMHYIRILKQPRLLPRSPSAPPRSPDILSTKITITTDLGESFLRSDVKLRADIDFNGVSVVTGAEEYLWKGKNGMRSLEIQIPIHVSPVVGSWITMIVNPAENEFAVDSFEDVLGKKEGGIVNVRSRGIDLKTGETKSEGMAERVFSTGFQSGEELRIWEETGESIARHICRSFSAGRWVGYSLLKLIIS